MLSFSHFGDDIMNVVDPGLICLKHIWSSLSLNCWYSKEKFSSNSTVAYKSNESEFHRISAKFAEIVGYLKESEFEFLSILGCTHCSHIIEILHDILFHGQQNFVWESEILSNSLFGKRNFVHHFVWNMEHDACTLDLKVLFFSEDGLSLKFVHRHLKSLIYFDVLGDFSHWYLPQETQEILR